MTRGRLYVGLGLLLLLLGCLAALWAVFGPSKAERAFNRIRLGMTRSEVESAVGLPPEDYSYSQRRYPIPFKPIREFGVPYWCQLTTEHGSLIRDLWIWDNHQISVAFDRNGYAVGISLLKGSPMTFFEWLRDFLGI